MHEAKDGVKYGIRKTAKHESSSALGVVCQCHKQFSFEDTEKWLSIQLVGIDSQDSQDMIMH